MMNTVRIILSLFLAFNVSAQCFAEPEPASIDEVILVFKTHFDIGYTGLASEVIENYRTTMIDNALDVVDASKDLPEDKKFVWMIPGWPMAAILKDQPSERATRLDRAIREGRFAVHALPFTLHTETLVEEDLVRGLRFSSNIAKQYGLSLPTDAKMTDVPCHSWILPTLLAHAGVIFMHEGTNPGSYDPEIPILHFREGPDGSRVLTMHVEGYGSGLEPPENWQYRTWLWLIHTGDNHGPPRPDEVLTYLKECEIRFPHANIRIGRLSDFGNAILQKEDVSKIPVVKGDMPDTWIHGPMCDPQRQRLARAVHERLTYQEIFDTLYGQPQTQRLADAWEQSLLYGEHTWGAPLDWLCNYGIGQTLPFGNAWKALENGKNFSPDYLRTVESWEEKSDYIRRAVEAFPPNDSDNPSMIFNPLPWDLVDDRGRILAPGAVSNRPALEPRESATEVRERTTISTTYFALTVDPKTSEFVLEDLKNKRSVFRKGELPGFFYHRADAATCDKFVEDYCIPVHNWVINQFGKMGLPPDVPERRMKYETFKRVALQSDSVSKQIHIEFESGESCPFKTLTVKVALYEHRPEVRFTFEGTAKEPDTWPEAGYFHFPLAIENSQFRLGRLGGIVDPATEIVRGSNRHFQWLRTGVAVFGEDGYGMGICPVDSPLVSLDKPGGWLFSKDFVPKKPDVWFNLFNNQWTTNFRLWNEGDVHSSFVLWTFDKYDHESSLITPCLETFALDFQPVGSSTPIKNVQGIRLDRKGIYVTALGKDPDCGEMMLRMWEMTGQDASPVTVQLPETFSAKFVQPCDLRGVPIGEAIPVTNGTFKIEVKPYTPISLTIH